MACEWHLALRRFLLTLAVCLVFAAAAIPTTKKPPLKPININTATSEELQQVPGIGPATAEKILLMRKSYGAFKSVDDLLAIRGIGKKRLEKMRKYLTVAKSPAAIKPSQPTSPPSVQKKPATPPAAPATDAEEPPK
jgi:comEA protein